MDQILARASIIIDRWLEIRYKAKHVPSLAVGIVRNNKTLLSKGYGWADAKRGIKATNKTTYRIASISKIFTAIAIMQLVEQKKINLNRPVTSYLPEFDTAKNNNKVLVKHLLSHTGGILRDGQRPFWVNDKFPNKNQLWTDLETSPVYKPGKKFKYSNYGYGILGQLIEKITGRTYKQYVQKHIIKPLGLKNTSPVLTPKIIKNLAVGYSFDWDGPINTFSNPETKALQSATGFSTNIEDMIEFIKAQITGKHLSISPKSRQQMMRRKIKNNEASFGLGYELWDADKIHLYGHTGGFAGFNSCFAINNKTGVGIALITNTQNAGMKYLGNKIFSTFDYFVKNKKHLLPINKKYLEYEGLYKNRWGYVSIMATAKGLIAFSPEYEPALNADVSILLPGKVINSFTITGKSGFDSIGEEAQFRNKNSTLFWGSQPYKRVKKY